MIELNCLLLQMRELKARKEKSLSLLSEVVQSQSVLTPSSVFVPLNPMPTPRALMKQTKHISVPSRQGCRLFDQMD